MLLSSIVDLQQILPLQSRTSNYGRIHFYVRFSNKFGRHDNRSLYCHCFSFKICCIDDNKTSFSYYLLNLVILGCPCIAAIEYFVEHHTTSQATKKGFEVPRILVTELIPAVLLVIVTGRILIIRRKHQRQAASQVSQILYNKRIERTGCRLKLARKKEMSSVPMICTVVCVFIVCYAVNISLSICFGLEACSEPPEEVQDVLGILLIVNSLINPCAYAFLKRDIKRECKLFLCGKLVE